MEDKRLEELARTIVNYSTKVKKGEKVWIESYSHTEKLTRAIYREVLKVGGIPTLSTEFEATELDVLKYGQEKQFRELAEIKLENLKERAVFIGIGGRKNNHLLDGIDEKKIAQKSKADGASLNYRVQNMKWCITRFPNKEMAKRAGMSLKSFENLYYSSCLLDWEEESRKYDNLIGVLENKDKIKILGKNTELNFSIKGRKFCKSEGKRNMPGGEIYTAPVEDSVNGFIEFDYPVLWGKEIGGIFLKFKEGKVFEARAKKNQAGLDKLISLDEGTKRIGEWGIGLNPAIVQYTGDTLFDEKMCKTIHLALGTSHLNTGGKNKSATHEDIIKNMSAGEIYVDNKLVMKNGVWLIGK